MSDPINLSLLNTVGVALFHLQGTSVVEQVSPTTLSCASVRSEVLQSNFFKIAPWHIRQCSSYLI